MAIKKYTSVFDAIYADDQDKSAEMQFRSDMLMLLRSIFEKKGWNQKEIMEQLGISQPRASELQREQISKFSSDKLISYLARAGYKIHPTLQEDNTVVAQAQSIHSL